MEKQTAHTPRVCVHRKYKDEKRRESLENSWGKAGGPHNEVHSKLLCNRFSNNISLFKFFLSDDEQHSGAGVYCGPKTYEKGEQTSTKCSEVTV